MAFISVTRLKIKSLVHLPLFLWQNEACAKALVQTPGFLGGKELIDKHLTFWTMTVWQDVPSMKTFRSSAAHRKAMQKLPGWCSEATYVHWEQDSPALAEWSAAHVKMVQEGVVSKVRHPSARHLSKDFPAPAWSRTERLFRPVLPLPT